MNQHKLLPNQNLVTLSSVTDITDTIRQSDSSASLASNYGNLPIYRHFEQYAREFPQSIAIAFGEAQISYGELNSQANQLANYLISQNVQPQDHLGVFVEPGSEILLALLTIHKINAVYVPIDTEYPLGRIKIIIEQVAPVAIIGRGDRLSEIENRFNIKIINLSKLDLSTCDRSNLDYTCSPDSRSHIFFTSGTTGTPKGVISNHSNLIHYIFAAQEKYRFTAEDSFLAAARSSFSISLLSLLLPLVAGGRVNMITLEQLLEPNLLAKAIERSTFFHLNPSLLNILLDRLEQDVAGVKRFHHVKHASSGGDMIPFKILNRLNKIFTQAEVYAIYGSSEISCMGCTYFVPKELEIEQTLVGKPFNHVELRVLDRRQEIVPVGVKGEIYFGGQGITQGYLNSPNLTEEKYILLDGKRFYRTGDIGRLNQQGNLQMLGREDNQVQIRGMRIELAEIEFYLSQHPALSNCVVIAKEDRLTEKQLIAYLIAQNEPPTCDRLQDFLQPTLPQYMIPAHFVFIQEFPLNPNGKVDRRALSALPLALQQNIIAPQTATQQQLVTLWQEVLGLEQIGIEDNFFSLGGHSLLAVTLAHKIEQALAIKLPFSMVFQMSTIQQQASFLELQGEQKSYSTLVPIQPKGMKPPLFLFQGIGIYYPLSSYLGEEQPVYGLAIEMIDESEHWLERVADLVALYIKEIKTVQPKGPYYLGGLSFGGMVAFEAAQQLRVQGEEVALLALFDTWDPKAYTIYPLYKRMLTHLQKFSRSPFKYLFFRLTNTNKFLKLKQKFLQLGKFNSNLPPENQQEKNEQQLNKVPEIYLKAQENYIPQIYSGKVTVFKAMQECDDMLAFGEFKDRFGWGNLVTGELDIINIPGDHFGILKEPYVETLARELKRCLVVSQKPDCDSGFIAFKR
jgi:amino acid adenylation domain-containing protein